MTAAAEWVWMPHPAHFICASRCRFFLATEVGGYIVSTVGEYVPDAGAREILAECRGMKLEGHGDARENDWMKKNGFEEIGLGRTYETMVFPSKRTPKDKCACCEFVPADFTEVDAAGYAEPKAAREGHLKLCAKWSVLAEGAP